jgi:hypothetical protein
MNEAILSFDINNPLHLKAIEDALAAQKKNSLATTGIFRSVICTKFLVAQSKVKPAKIVTGFAREGPLEKRAQRIIIRKPQGSLNMEQFRILFGYPKPFHKTLLARVRVIYDFHGLNVPYDFNGDPKTKKMVGFRNKSTIKIAAAVQQVCPSDTNTNFAA